MKNQAKAKQHREAELLLFENYFLSHQRYHPKYWAYSKNCASVSVWMRQYQIVLIKIKRIRTKDLIDTT